MNNNKLIFDEKIYEYILTRQTSRAKFYFIVIAVFGAMIYNELYLYNDFLKFNIVGCRNVTLTEGKETSNSNKIYESLHSFSNCIDNEIHLCIPKLYPSLNQAVTPHEKALVNESLSFSVSLFSDSINNPKFKNEIQFRVILMVLYLFIIFVFVVLERYLYITRTRAHQLFCMGLLLRKEDKYKRVLIPFGLSILVLVYFTIRTLATNRILEIVSVIQCNSEGSHIELLFEKKFQSLVQVFFSFLVFLFVFKEPIQDVISNMDDYYKELTLVDFVLSKGCSYSMERKNNLKLVHHDIVIRAVEEYVFKKYGPITLYHNIFILSKQNRRSEIFQFFLTTKDEFIQSIQEYYQLHTNEFPVHNNKLE